MMTECSICHAPFFGYVQQFQGRKKAASYPACLTHYAAALVYEKIGQETVRDFLAWALPLRRSTIPRIKVSLKR